MSDAGAHTALMEAMLASWDDEPKAAEIELCSVLASNVLPLLARAWWEGHMTDRRLGPDDCQCAAWNESECGCGEYGTNVITLNPYDRVTTESPESYEPNGQFE